MSSHSVRAKARHAQPVAFSREVFEVAHVTFELQGDYW